MGNRVGVVTSLLFISACNNQTAPPDIGYGTQYDVTESGIVATPLDPSDGQFEEPVQVSPDWLEIRVGRDRQAIYVPKSDTPPDLSYFHFGRSKVEIPLRETPVDVQLSGLDWRAGDSLQLVSPNLGLAIHDFQIHLAYPSHGVKEVSGQRMDWLHAQAPLVDASQGDRTWIAQMSVTPLASGSHYIALTRAGVTDKFSVSAEGHATKLAATLQPVPRDRTFTLRWRGRAFAALVAEAGPHARQAATPALAIRTLPQALVENNNFYQRHYMYLPSVVDFGPLRADADVTETIRYGNPFATSSTKWRELVSVVYSMPVVIPGGGVTHARLVQATPIADAAGELAPAISPVRNVRIDGRPANVAQASTGRSPTVSWDAPRLGRPSTYAITIRPIARMGTGSTVMTAGTFYTASTSITIPERALDGVNAYVLAVTAISANGRDLATTPFLASLPFASADYITAKITP